MPYLGDLAKAGKLPKYVGSVVAAVSLAGKNKKFAKAFRPIAEQLYDVIKKIPVDELPEGVAKQIKKIEDELAGMLGKGIWVKPKGWRLPKNGKWSGTRGDSDFIPDDPASLGLKSGEVIPFRSGYPDFSKWSRANFTAKEPLTGVWKTDQGIMIRTIAEQKGWTQQQVKDWLKTEELSPHHAGGNRIQLIPWALHGNPRAIPPRQGIRHMGGAYDLRNH